MSRRKREERKNAVLQNDAPESRWDKALGWIAVASVFILACLLSIRKVSEMDLGFHLRAGEWILEHRTWPRTDPFTYTVSDHPYIDIHWLYQLMLVGLYHLGGFPALVLSHTAFILAAFFIMMAAARSHLRSPLALAPLLLIGVLASELRFMLRPETVSWIFLGLTFYLLERRSRGQPSPLWVLPFIHLLWVNMQGLFILGWIILFSYLLGDLLEKKHLDRKLALWSLASVLICLANPYLHQGVLFPLTLLTRLSGENPFGQNISEFTSPWRLKLTFSLPFYPRASLWSYYIFSVFSIGVLILTLRRSRIRELLIFIIFFIFSVQAIRNIPLFILVAIPVTGHSLAELAAGLFKKGKNPGRKNFLLFFMKTRTRRILAASAIVLPLALSLRVITNRHYIVDRREERLGTTLSNTILPIGAADFLLEKNIAGPVFNHLNYGGYLMWKLGQPVLIDGRLEVMGEKFYKEYLTAERDITGLLKKYPSDVVIFPFLVQRSWLQQLHRMSGWRLVYSDHASAVFFRQGVLTHVRKIEFPDKTPGGIEIPVLGETRADLLHIPRRIAWAQGLKGFFQKQEFPAIPMQTGIFYYYIDDLDRAEAFLLEALRQSEGRYFEVYNNLGAVYYKKKMMPEASLCYRIVLEENPENEIARRRVQPVQ